LRDLGYGDVAVAVAYHAGRWLTPGDPAGPVRFLEDGVVHFESRGKYAALTPTPGAEVRAGGDPLGDCLRGAEESGLAAHAWTVLFHNSRLGHLHPQSTVCNAWGNRYSYALCPAREEVRRYGVALVGDIANREGLGAVELEALGWMGHRHGSHHDKSSFASDPFTDFLLSYCFCDVCRVALGDRGVDAAKLALRFGELLRGRLEEGDAMAPVRVAPGSCYEALTDALGDDVLAALVGHRQATVQRSLREMRAVLPQSVELTLHVHLDPLFTGSQVGGASVGVAELVDELIVTHYGEGPEQIEKRWSGVSLPGCRVRLALWPKAPEFGSDDDLVRVAELVRQVGFAGVRIYHLGLLPWRTVERVAGVLGQA
jgi:hypothetical protein